MKTPTPKGTGRTTRKWKTKIRPQTRKQHQQQNAPCWICNQPIDYTLKHPHPEAWEPDHIHTVATHPELAEDPANLKPSHSHCNKTRGNTNQTTPQLGNQSRNW